MIARQGRSRALQGCKVRQLRRLRNDAAEVVDALPDGLADWPADGGAGRRDCPWLLGHEEGGAIQAVGAWENWREPQAEEVGLEQADGAGAGAASGVAVAVTTSIAGLLVGDGNVRLRIVVRALARQEARRGGRLDALRVVDGRVKRGFRRDGGGELLVWGVWVRAGFVVRGDVVCEEEDDLEALGGGVYI